MELFSTAKLQSTCSVDNIGTGDSPSLQCRREYRILRTLWAKGELSQERAIVGKGFAPLDAIRWLSKKGVFPALDLSDDLTFSELCQLAFLWAMMGEMERAEDLACRLLPLTSFYTLWTPEDSYDENESALSARLLLHAFGRAEAPSDEPFFNRLQEVRFVYKEKEPLCQVGTFSKMSAAFTLRGRRSSLGQIVASDAQIRALGPQIFPLSEPRGFGILRSDGEWVQCAGAREIWFSFKAQFKEKSCHLEMRFVGIERERPMAFVFYVKAPLCSIESQVFKPKSLIRYNGFAKKFQFSPTLSIELSDSLKSELIPLAGSGEFWGADFLLSFEIPPVDGRLNFHIN